MAAKKKKTTPPPSSSILKRLLLASLAILAAYFFVSKSEVATPPARQFAYIQEGKLYVYSATKDTSTLVEGSANVEQIEWSEDGKLAYKDSGGVLYLVDQNRAKKLQDKLQGYFYWKADGTAIYNWNFWPGDSAPEYLKKINLVSLEGKATPSSTKEYEAQFLESVKNTNSKASYDGRYMAKISYFDDRDNEVYLADTKTDKTYRFPDGAWGPRISTQNTYVAYKDNRQETELTLATVGKTGGVKIIKMRDALAGKFDKPIATLPTYEYRWIDDKHIAYFEENLIEGKNDTLRYDHIYKVLDVSSGKTQEVYKFLNTSQGFADLFLIPEKDAFMTRITTDDTGSVFDLVVISLKNGSEIKRIPFDTGQFYPSDLEI